MAKHWTQTPEGKARMAKISRDNWTANRGRLLKIARKAAANARAAKKQQQKRGPYKPKKMVTKEPVSVQILGWRFIFEGEEIKIERA